LKGLKLLWCIKKEIEIVSNTSYY